MKKYIIPLGLLILVLLLHCGGGNKLKLGNCPLTVTVMSDDEQFDGFANIYIDGKFIGTTDAQTKALRVNLKKGEYVLIVTAEGHNPWRTRVMLLGDNYKQNVLARLKKAQSPPTGTQRPTG